MSHKNKKLRICMASDFFYPNTGGVESHIYQLSQCLMSLGHKVVILAHVYDNRTGVRYMTRGMKVYYIPVLVIYNECTLPTLYATLPLVRSILIREQIDIVHGHSAFSALAHEAMMHAKTLGLRTVFTDHSLFGFADASAVITNKLLQMSLSVCDRVVCVSDPNQRQSDNITIIVISRLVYRKGVDLLAGAIPIICERHPRVQFLIGGDGPKRIVLEEVIEHNQLQDRVTLLGSVKHEDVRDVLVKGDIFLNSSLTEAFCMAIVEAASCGLQVVSTNVGGIPEVLPSGMIWLSEPSVDGLINAIERAINDKDDGKVLPPHECHKRIQRYYQWDDIAKRTLKVYEEALERPRQTLRCRLQQLMSCGPMFGPVFVMIALIEYVLFLLCCWFIPVESIDIAVDFNDNESKSDKTNH